MRVRPLFGPQMGTELDRPDAEAQVLISRGLAVAVAVAAPKKPASKKKATPKKKRGA